MRSRILPCLMGSMAKKARKKKTRRKKATNIHDPNGWWDAFFDAFLETRDGPRAAALIGVPFNTVHSAKTRNPEFAKRWEDVWKTSVYDLESSAMSRAINGWDEPLHFKGEIFAYKRVYSPALTIFMLKANMPDRYHLERQVADASAEEQARMMRQFLVATTPKALTVVSTVEGEDG